MRVERYNPKYHDDIARLVKEFQAESLDEYGLTFNDEALASTVEDIKSQNTGFMLIVNDRCEGLLAGKEVKAPASDERIWHEVIWFVSRPYRKYGIKLLNAAKAILKAEGYSKIVMVYMHNSKSDKLYRLYTRLGYAPMETNFIGRL